MLVARQVCVRWRLLLSLIALLTVACGSDGPPSTTLSETFQDAEYGFRLRHPSDWSVRTTDLGVELSRGPARVTVEASPSYGATFEQHVASLRNPVLDAANQAMLSETRQGPAVFLSIQERPGRGEADFRRSVATASNGGFFIDDVGEVEDLYLAEYGPIITGVLESFAIFTPEADAATRAAEHLERGRYVSRGVEYRPLAPDTVHDGPPGGGRVPDIERFAFVGVEGTTYRVTSDAEAVRTRMLVRISAPDGCTLVRGVDIDYTWTADQSGLFTLDVDSTASHPYILTVAEDASRPVDDHGGSACSATALDLSVSTLVRGETTHATDFDVFTFDAVAGSTYLIELDLETLEEADLIVRRRGAYLLESRERRQRAAHPDGVGRKGDGHLQRGGPRLHHPIQDRERRQGHLYAQGHAPPVSLATKTRSSLPSVTGPPSKSPYTASTVNPESSSRCCIS